MIDLASFQDSILLEWVESLMSNEEQAWKTYPKIFFEPLGGRTVFKSRIKMDSFRGLHKIKSSFWRAVLTKWLSHSYHEVVVLKRSDPINNNNCVKYRKRDTLPAECNK